MSEWFFSDSENVARLKAEVDTWRGTPFARYSKAKGPHGGCDCENYVEALYVAVGVIEPINAQRTEHDYNPVLHNNRILDFIRGINSNPRSPAIAARFAELPIVDKEFVEPPMAGDLLVNRMDTRKARELGQGLWHLMVMIGPRKFTSCVGGLGVTEGMIQDETYKRHFFAHFRPRAVPLTPA